MRERRLQDAAYLAFPFRVDDDGPALAESRAAHVREQIEQALFTDPPERIFRPEHGVGVRRLVFEPNDSALWRITEQRLVATLTTVLAGEVDPRSLDVHVGADVESSGERLDIVISYRLATIDRLEKLRFTVGGGDG